MNTFCFSGNKSPRWDMLSEGGRVGDVRGVEQSCVCERMQQRECKAQQIFAAFCIYSAQ